MKERPILFSGPMVRAILEGRKTQTRRPVKPQPEPLNDGRGGWVKRYPDGHEFPFWDGTGPVADTRHHNVCPYGQPGDRLWVRETFIADKGGVIFRADEVAGREHYSWQPSIHMPRWASRITLEITAVRVERLQEISEEDSKAEGANRYDPTAYFTVGQMGRDNISDWEFRSGFAELWSSVYGTWSANPWVWVVEFRRTLP